MNFNQEIQPPRSARAGVTRHSGAEAYFPRRCRLVSASPGGVPSQVIQLLAFVLLRCKDEVVFGGSASSLITASGGKIDSFYGLGLL